ncbi:hypothetical protein GL218_05778 [Daldinia childiae]|uniref:uncharacterized protein n=1 Tax=Daldinia childiae TaxID=326645 RepID=UPI0014473F6B|nr:uncharacterized protein GL218_05778 [Daldinia childiae]KAF3058070.1 hypothetical protein GL218_05778 [Daldinia childiae]
MNAPRDPQKGNRASDLLTKRKRADTDPIAPNKKPKLEASLNLSSTEDIKMLQVLESKYDIKCQLDNLVFENPKESRFHSQHLTSPATGKTSVIVLRAKASDTGKLVSVAEIAKRELEKRADDARIWFQYIALGEELKEIPRGDGNTIIEETKLGDTGDDDFETLKTPFERAIEGQPRWRGIPVMSLFLSPVSIEELKRRYGEQTNAGSK